MVVCKTGPPLPARSKDAVIALNAARIGHRYPTYHYEVSRAKIQEYARATGVVDAVYGADPSEVPAEDVLAPPTFAACFTLGGSQIIDDPELGAHWNLVHGSQEYVFERPVRAGDVLACTPSIVDVVERGGMELLTYAIECRDARTQEAVLKATSVIIFFPPQEG